MQPEITAHFDDIHRVLLREINSAESTIVAAVAWFTDREIFNALRRRAVLGVSVRVVITDDEINRPPMAPAFDALIDLGGEIHRIRPGTQCESLMHHKFCVIDETTVITGSYNWTRRARENAENVTIIRHHPSFVARFLDTFEQIVGQHTGAGPDIDNGRIRRRLELIRNLIQLGETEDLLAHMQKLQGVADEVGIRKALAAIAAFDYELALEEIEQWLARASTLVTTEDAEVPHLRLQLQVLEFELSGLSSEQADLERRLVVFSRRHHETLGELTQAVLFAQSVLKRLHAMNAERQNKQQAEEAEEAAQSAEDQYREYAEEREKIQAERPPQKLDAEREKNLKRMYRLACRLCHPDKVEESYKAKATEVFQQLEAAYRAQDFEVVRDILNMLNKGGWSLHERSSILDEASQLRGAIVEMEHNIAATVTALHQLKTSAGVQLMESLGDNDQAWAIYVERRQKELKEKLQSLQKQINACEPKAEKDQSP